MRSHELMASEAAALSVCRDSLGQSTIGTEIRRCAELQPGRVAIVSTGFEPLSYRELQCLIDEFRAALRLAGLSRHARIAIAIPNGPQAALAIVAVACSAVSIPLNPRQTLREIEMGLATLRPDAILLFKGTDSVARQAAEERGTAIIEVAQSKQGALGFESVEPQISTAATPDESDEPDPKAPAFILQTSGTASEPKLIPFSHRNMLAAAARVQAWFNLSPQDRCLSVSPVFYSHGLKVTVFTPLLTGGSIAFPTDATKFDYAEWFGFLKPTWYSAGPTLHRLIFDRTRFRADAATGHSLRFVLSGGAPLPQTVLEGLQNTLGVPVVEHYGSSEAAQISANLPPPGRSKPGTCGVPPPDTIVIVGDDGRRLPSGKQGEILVGGPTVISGYLDAPELNRERFIDGWFRSGDIGSIDEDGFLTLHGRTNDVINRGGEKISPTEIDDALMRHPAVIEAAAFPVPHARLGEDVVAAVVLRLGMTTTPVALRKYLQDQIAPFKVPRRIVFRDQLPKGTTGKVLRRRLTESWDERPAAETQVAASPVENRLTDKGLVKELTNLWERLLRIAPVSPDDDFFEKGGDSLLVMEMLAELEWRTGLTIPSSILFEATTIRQLVQKLSERESLRPKYLIELNSNGDQPPLIYFHGHFHGFGYDAITLAKLVGAKQPIFVVAPHGTGDEPIPRSIEAMAADRLPLIMKAQPEGPYRLGGKCIGGIVAFEVARMLVAAGKEVEMVFLLDPPTINANKSIQFLFSTMKRARPIAGPVVERAMAWTWFRSVQLQRFWNYPWTKREAAIQRRWTSLRTKLGKLVDRGNDEVSIVPIAVDRSGTPILGVSLKDARTSRYAAAMSNYRPKPLSVPVTYVKVDFGIGAWRRVSPDLEVVTSPGTHEYPDFSRVAEHLKVSLQPRKIN
jgi:acyl-CoA synthetase (AMP-forming)/AMP-acid ligase II/acyl carrier protein